MKVGIVGLGAMGSAVLYQLAKRGVEVVGFDQFDPPHTMGSSAGDTRITRLAVGEGEFYTPFAIRSHQIWKELEESTGLELLRQVGGLMMSSVSDESEIHGSIGFFDETIAAAKKHNIKHEILGVDDIKYRYPQFSLVGDEVGYFEPTAGFLRPENCIKANLFMARQLGARMIVNERIVNVFMDNKHAVVRGTHSGLWGFDKVIVSAGAWVKRFLMRYQDKFQVQRQVQYWFKLDSAHYEAFLPDRFPVFIWIRGGGFVYGFPAIDGPGGGIKLATEIVEEVDPGSIRRYVMPSEFDNMYVNFVEDRFPVINRDCVKTAVCMYTKTPDSHFVLDFHPEHPQVIIASPCSGHGFKHSAAIGEALADLAIDGNTRFDISHFGLDRFKV